MGDVLLRNRLTWGLTLVALGLAWLSGLASPIHLPHPQRADVLETAGTLG